MKSSAKPEGCLPGNEAKKYYLKLSIQAIKNLTKEGGSGNIGNMSRRAKRISVHWFV